MKIRPEDHPELKSYSTIFEYQSDDKINEAYVVISAIHKYAFHLVSREKAGDGYDAVAPIYIDTSLTSVVTKLGLMAAVFDEKTDKEEKLNLEENAPVAEVKLFDDTLMSLGSALQLYKDSVISDIQTGNSPVPPMIRIGESNSAGRMLKVIERHIEIPSVPERYKLGFNKHG
jgi:hypothetical protein